jgi:Zn-dependent protease
MKWSFKLTRIAGTDVNIHLTFFLLLAWIGHTSGATGVLFVVLLFGCVLLHEFGHVFAARAFGVRTPDITLYPIGGVARLERMPKKPFQELMVALAGPAVNVVIALFLFGLIGAGTVMGALTNPSGSFLVQLAVVNVWLVIFNLIPAFPMDGGRVLRSVLAMRMNRSRATDIAAQVGKVFAVGFGVLGLFYNPMLIFIAIFVYFGATQEAIAARMEERGTSPSARPFGSARSDSPPPANHGRAPVIDDSGNVVGWVDEEETRRPRSRVVFHRF